MTHSPRVAPTRTAPRRQVGAAKARASTMTERDPVPLGPSAARSASNAAARRHERLKHDAGPDLDRAGLGVVFFLLIPSCLSSLIPDPNLFPAGIHRAPMKSQLA